MSEIRDLRDPVHGFIQLNGKEADIMDTRVFQRLRGIRQVALSSLVYPGATHTRFEHTLGVLHVTSLLCRVFQKDFADEDARLVRLSALLHDLGHGPFSHVSEGALEVYADRARLRGRLGPREKIHELVTQDLLRTDPDLLRLIGKSDLDKIQLLLSQGYGEPVLRSVVSGPLDADKQDYLLRDSYYCGVKYGIFDLQQLHRELRVVEDPADGHRVLAISADGVHALEQFVLAKYYLTGQVYSHRVRLITDQMLLRAITLAIDCDGIDELRQLYSYDGQDRFVRDYTEWDDARFMLEFGGAKHKGSYCQHLLVRLARRRLLKQVFESRVSRLPESCGERVETIAKPENRAGRRELEGRLAEACGAPAFN